MLLHTILLENSGDLVTRLNFIKRVRAQSIICSILGDMCFMFFHFLSIYDFELPKILSYGAENGNLIKE